MPAYMGVTSPDNPDNALAAALAGGSPGYSGGSNPLDPNATSGLNAGTGVAGSNQLDNSGAIIVKVGGYSLSLDDRVRVDDSVPQAGTMKGSGNPVESSTGGVSKTPPKAVTKPKVSSVSDVLSQFGSWTDTQYNTFKQQAYQAGLTSSKNASKQEVLGAWQTVVEEASIQKKNPTDLIKSASTSGWSSINPTIEPGDHGLGGTGNQSNQSDATVNSTTSGTTAQNTINKTTTVSYMDPATAQETLLQTMQKYLGRAPKPEEYQAFLNTLYNYQDQANSGSFDAKATVTDSDSDKSVANTPTTGAASGVNSPDTTTTTDATGNTVTNQSIVTQRGISAGGVDFLAQNSALSNPEYGQYQAATTYFNALIKALSGPASGMSS